MGLKSNKNFIHTNAVENIMSVAKKPQPKYVDTPGGTTNEMEVWYFLYRHWAHIEYWYIGRLEHFYTYTYVASSAMQYAVEIWLLFTEYSYRIPD